MANSAFGKNTSNKIMSNGQTTVVTTSGQISSPSSYVDVPGMSVAITPSSSSSKVLLIVSVNYGVNGAASIVGTQLMRGSSAINQAAANTNAVRTTVTDFNNNSTTGDMNTTTLFYVDSPATTSATTYKIQAILSGGTNLYYNRSGTDTDSNAFSRGVSVISAIEIVS